MNLVNFYLHFTHRLAFWNWVWEEGVEKYELWFYFAQRAHVHMLSSFNWIQVIGIF